MRCRWSEPCRPCCTSSASVQTCILIKPLVPGTIYAAGDPCPDEGRANSSQAHHGKLCPKEMRLEFTRPDDMNPWDFYRAAWRADHISCHACCGSRIEAFVHCKPGQNSKKVLFKKADAVRSSDLKAPQARVFGAGILRGGTKGSPRSCASSRLDLDF